MNEEEPKQTPRTNTGAVIANDIGCVLMLLIVCVTLLLIIMTLSGVFG